MSILNTRTTFLYLALAFSIAACGKENTPSAPAVATNEATNAAPQEGDGGNAGDESMPNTMAMAALEGSRTTYTGKIDRKIEATLELYQTDNDVRGTITYKKGGKPIMVLGKFTENGSFFFREFLPDGQITGVMSGKSSDGKLSGYWYGNEKDLDFQMAQTDQMPGEEWPFSISGSVSGEYAYHFPAEATGDPGAAGTLKVKQNGNSVTFSFDCVNGPPAYNMATVEDTEGELQDNAVQVTLADFDCQFEIRFYKGFAVVAHIDEHYDCGFGNGAGIEGEYVKVR